MLQQPYICLWVLYDGRESRVKLLLIAIGPYSVILDACVVITALIKRPENSFQLTVGRWKFNIFSVSKVYEQNGLTASTKLRLRGHLKMVFIEKSPISGPPPPIFVTLCRKFSPPLLVTDQKVTKNFWVNHLRKCILDSVWCLLIITYPISTYFSGQLKEIKKLICNSFMVSNNSKQQGQTKYYIE